ncbi:unnamed protein product [Phytomonas sp. EM1]|nr:unnamed protein product [Phytomonas sp. EM1]|eukprot:CCW59772.1 unnamed protein product [Phytomonas sp. isolate EM1]
MHEQHWVQYLPPSGSEHPSSEEMTNLLSVGWFVGDLYRRAYAAHGERIYTNLAVPRWVGGRRASGTTHITITPPLFALKPRPIDEANNEMRRTFPVIFHTPGFEPGFTKVMLLEFGAIGSRWFVPMACSPEARRQAMQYLASAPLFLSTSNSIIRDSYHAKCGFPFAKTIRKARKL